jgi:nicotinate-nucleotide--dimethylbenzimidazole phosphoribosyltransferase
MPTTAPTALLPALAAWARDTALTTSLTGDTGQPPALLSVTADESFAAETTTGGSRLASLASTVGVDVRVHPVAPAAAVGLDADEVEERLAEGAALTDHAVDSGVPLLLLSGSGSSATDISSAAVTATVCRKEPVAVVRHEIGADVAVWRDAVETVRDAMFRARGYRNGPWDAGSVREILRILGTPDLTVMVGVLTQAAARRAPVILDGADTFTAALLADAMSPGAARWWLVPHRPVSPTVGFTVDRLRLSPVVDRDLGLDTGAGLATLPLVRIAADYF